MAHGSSIRVSSNKYQVSSLYESFGAEFAMVGNGKAVGFVANSLSKLAGRGIFLAHTYFDSVDFNEKGNEVTMIKNLHPESGEKT